MDSRVSCRDVWMQADLIDYSPDVDSDATGSIGDQRATGLPERRVTPNMLVGYNMARWRQAMGLTQEQLGERLGGWGKTAVSAAERSWDGKRVRQFDADLVVRLAAIFGVPISALYMPPPEDKVTVLYVVDTGDGVVRMSDFFVVYLLAVPDFSYVGNPAAHAYDEVLVAAVAKYAGSWLAGDVTARLSRRAADARLGTALSRALADSSALAFIQDSLADMRADNDLLKDLLTTMLRETEEGRAQLAQQDESSRRAAGSELPGDVRERQTQLIAIGHEIFGERGPATNEEIERVMAEGRSRGIDGAPWVRERLLDGEWELVEPVRHPLDLSGVSRAVMLRNMGKGHSYVVERIGDKLALRLATADELARPAGREPEEPGQEQGGA